MAKAEAGLKDLTSVAKAFFKVLAEKYKGIAVGNAVEMPVVEHKEGIEEEKPEAEDSDNEHDVHRGAGW